MAVSVSRVSQPENMFFFVDDWVILVSILSQIGFVDQHHGYWDGDYETSGIIVLTDEGVWGLSVVKREKYNTT